MGSGSPEVVVVGAGITGASTAFHLARQGAKTTLIERHYPAGGPTGYSSAVLHAFYLMPELSQLAKRGTDILRDLKELAGGDSGFTQIGTLWVCGPESANEYRDAVRRIREEGAEIEALTPDQIAEMAPDFDLDGIAVGVWEPTCGYADPSTATNSIVEGARAHGAEIVLNSGVVKLISSDGRVTGVETDKGARYGADVVVIAAGPWSRAIVADVGVDLPTFAERHSMAVVAAPGRATSVMPFSWVDDIKSNYARPEGENLILVGTWAGAGTGHRNVAIERESAQELDDYKSSVETEESLDILRTIVPRVPAVADYGVRPGYAGLYDMSPDDNPIHSWVPGVEGLFVAAGTSGHGFKMGPGVGEAIAQEILTGDSPLLAPFRLDRF